MAVTQYIGARYVPLFYENPNGTNEWLSGIAYDPLTIVTYLTQSFTSKKPVPAGIGNPADNPDYWCQTGAYNAQVEQYRQEVEDLADTVEAGLIAAANDSDKNIIIITDSYGLANDPSVTNVWPEIFRVNAGLTTNVNFRLAALGGAGFGVSTTFASAITTMANGMTDDEKAAVTDLIIAGGANDYWVAVSALETAIESTIALAKTYFPNAAIRIAMIGNIMQDIDKRVKIATHSLVAYQRCGKYGGRYMSNCHLAMQTKDNFLADLLHPSQAGHYEIANAIYNALYGSYYNSLPDRTATLTLDSQWGGGSVSFTTECNGDVLQVGFYTPATLTRTAANLTGNVPIGTVDDPSIIGNVMHSVYAPTIINGDKAGLYIMEYVVLNNILYMVVPASYANVSSVSISRAGALWNRITS